MTARGTPSVVPLDRDPANRILPWVISVMTYLAVLATAGYLIIYDMTTVWQNDLGDRLTVQLPASQSDADTDRAELAVDALTSTPGVVSAQLLSGDDKMKLLEPWLGQNALSDTLPVPFLIDVELSAQTPVDLEALEVRVRQIVPEAEIDAHKLWVQDILKTIRWFQVLSIIVLGFIASAAIGVIIATTRAGLAMHHQIIDILQTVGARDRFIAQQFQVHAFILGLRGGLTGFALAAVSILILEWSMSGLGQSLLPSVRLSWTGWVIVSIVPILAICLAAITARLTVMRALNGRFFGSDQQ